MKEIKKYPRTPHIEGSNIQEGDFDLNQIPFTYLKNKYLVIEEKVDGSNVGISFTNGELILQNRSHALEGGYKERQYDLFKVWVNTYSDEFYKVIGERYIIYGEWMYAKHNIYYDNLPHYFLEFDVYDKERNVFLDTKSRRELLKDLNLFSVPVLKEGYFKSYKEILDLLSDSNYISEDCSSRLMEGLYIKIEEDNIVKERFKYVRKQFKQVQEGNNDFYKKQIIPNKIKKGE